VGSVWLSKGREVVRVWTVWGDQRSWMYWSQCQSSRTYWTFVGSTTTLVGN